MIEKLVTNTGAPGNIASAKQTGEGTIPADGEPFEPFERGSIDQRRRRLHRLYFSEAERMERRERAFQGCIVYWARPKQTMVGPVIGCYGMSCQGYTLSCRSGPRGYELLGSASTH